MNNLLSCTALVTRSMARHLYDARICLFIICCTVAFSSSAQLRINEILVSNASTNVDPVDSAYADWVEIYNDSDADVNLKGYYLTDNLGKPTKWQIATDTIIKSKGYLIFWCDDLSSGSHTNFKLSADGEQIGLFSPQKEVVDTFSFSAQFVDISYGRSKADPTLLCYYMEPTPDAENSTTAYNGCANQPEIMTLGGFYQSPVTVTITQDLGGKVYYTLDGTEPDSSSNVYTAPIEISKTTVLRARIIEEGLIPGKVITASYFINEGFESHHLPVVSIATAPDNFWDSEKGIYVQSYKPEWEVPVNIELFDNNGSDRAAFNEAAGIKVNGLYSWLLPQKMLGVYFRKQYGEGKLSHQLFFDSDRTTFNNFALRASGNDWSNTLFRDGMLQQACRHGNVNVELMDFRPSIVFVNGEFLGVHNIREKVDDDYISSNFGLENGTFDMIESGDYVETGDMTAWDSLSTIFKEDLSVQQNFDELAKSMDVDNTTDYLTTELYCGNKSFDHNTMAWKPKGSGKWRWILMDTDRGFFGFETYLMSYYISETVLPLSNMIKNEDYKTYLCKNVANRLFTSFNPITMLPQINTCQNDIEPVMDRHIARWLGTTSSYGNAMASKDYWYNQVEKVRSFAAVRPIIVLQDLTNYGSGTPSLLSLSAQPAEACTWLFNNMKTTQSAWYGPYPQNMPVNLTFEQKAGYNFIGWKPNKFEDLISKGSAWSYLDDGSDQGTAWKETSFDDAQWASGATPLGYGITGVKTTVSYGSSSSNKHITTYFRKTFNVSTDLSEILSLKMNLLREDGAIVYLNGQKILTSNMPVATEPSYTTCAIYACGGLAETTYSTYDVPLSDVKQGENTIAVEVHQVSATSSDMIFDMQLIAEEKDDTAKYVSTDPTYNFSLQGDKSLTAVFEANGEDLVADSILSDMTFFKAKSPYIVRNDVVISENATLTIEPGVQVWMSPGTSFYVHGAINAQGTASDSILFKLNPTYGSDNWGALCFINATDTTTMQYTELRDASDGPAAYNCVAAISAFNSVLRLNHLRLTDNDSNPIAARYSDIKVSNSNIHSDVTGDLVNVKYGKGEVTDCLLQGNGNEDADGIDFDGVTDGIIKRVRISDFTGQNSDAIDLGERCKDIRIDSVEAYNITDKGVSVGQRSNAHIANSTFIKTNSGISVKDSSSVVVDRCTFFATTEPVACYEKVFGRAGGNAAVYRSILSNSYNMSILCDDKSQVYIADCLSDNDTLPEGHGNLFGDPGFVAAGLYDLHLQTPFTPAIGSEYLPADLTPDVTITEIGYNTTGITNGTEYLRLYNPGSEDLDISCYTLSDAIDYTFPEGTILPAKSSIYVAKDSTMVKPELAEEGVFQWTDGSLANEGETIQLSDVNAFIIDQVTYSPSTPWPAVNGNGNLMALCLKDNNSDNHLPANWTTKGFPTAIKTTWNDESETCLTVDNKAKTVTAHFADGKKHLMQISTIGGQQLFAAETGDGETIHLGQYNQSVVMIKVCDSVEKVLLEK